MASQADLKRDRNFTSVKADLRQQQLEQSIRRYLDDLETADRPQHQVVTVIRRCGTA